MGCLLVSEQRRLFAKGGYHVTKFGVDGDGIDETLKIYGSGFLCAASLVQRAAADYIASRKIGLDNILANPVRAGTQQP